MKTQKKMRQPPVSGFDQQTKLPHEPDRWLRYCMPCWERRAHVPYGGKETQRLESCKSKKNWSFRNRDGKSPSNQTISFRLDSLILGGWQLKYFWNFQPETRGNDSNLTN